jgi:Flp pilus assembly protein TadG
MRGLSSPGVRGVLDRLAGRRPGRVEDDRGAVAVIVAILLAGGVLLGFLALVIDVGELYLERQQLQSGADSAAIALARACATATQDCANIGKITALAQIYANQNSADGVSNVAEICGNIPGNLLNACSPPAHNRSDCLGSAPTDGSPYVEVHLTTETLDGKFVLPPVFAQTMAGNDGYTGASVGACARAGWHSSVTVLLMAISTCEFTHQTTDAGQDIANPRNERVINFWESAFDDHTCPVEPPPPLPPSVRFEFPPPPDPGQGQAALLDGSDCVSTLPADGDVTGHYPLPITFSLLPATCERALRAALAGDGTVYLPVYATNDVNGNGSVEFHITGLAPFHLTGFEWGPPPPLAPTGHNVDSDLTNDPVCQVFYGRCIAGVFTGPIISLTNVVPSANTIVKLLG